MLEISPKLNSALGQRGGIFEFKYLGEFKVELETASGYGTSTSAGSSDGKKPKAENLVFRYLFSFMFQEEGELLKRYGLAKQAGFQVLSYF